MNFLQLAKRVRQECGISGDGPSNVAGQNGVYAKIVAWVQSAYDEVQMTHPQWGFLWDRVEKPLVAGVEIYDPVSDWGLDFEGTLRDGLYLYRTVDGAASRIWVPVVDWALIRGVRVPSTTGMPIYAAMTPDHKLAFYPAPTAGLTAALEYYRNPQQLVDNTDAPRLPARFHMAIVWRAVMFWCAHDENPALFQSASLNYREWMNRIALSELPAMADLEPLA